MAAVRSEEQQHYVSEGSNTPKSREELRRARGDLAGRRHNKVFIDLPGGSGPYRKEIGELSQAELRTLEPSLRIRVVNRLLERYVDEHGRLDLLE